MSVEKQREVVLSCACGRSVLLQLDREAKTVRCSACGMAGAVSDFVARARRLPPDAPIMLADRPGVNF
jgi:LSD1 subclass zinc finger protein